MARTPSTLPSLLAKALRGAITGLLVGVVLHASLILGGSNFHTVLPGAVYRSGQPTGPRLTRLLREHGIRTVVNLRGCCPTADWYQPEAEAAASANVSLEDIAFSATRYPSPQSVRQLVDVIDHADYPILFHCQQGADRTGLASVLAVLLRTDATLEEGLRHMGLGTGHLAIGRTRYVDLFFGFYAKYLESTGLRHSPEVLRAWACDEYCPGAGRASMSLVRPSGGSPVRVRPDGPELLTVRCLNTSTHPWQFQPGTNAGIHLLWLLSDSRQAVVWQERAGLLRACVLPGESIDLVVALPRLAPGRYELLVDLTDEQVGTFVSLGNEPFLVEVLVP